MSNWRWGDPIDLGCVIMARGGSKRIPRKNLKDFCGKPLVEWSIIQACCAHCLGPENVYLTTDDEEIADVGRRHGIHIIDRPAEMAADSVTGSVPTLHAIGVIRQHRPFTHFMSLLPTSPCRHPDDVDRVWQTYLMLKPKYPNCWTLTPAIASEEMFVFKRLDDYRATPIVTDKSWRYRFLGPATVLHETDKYIEVHTDYVRRSRLTWDEGIWEDELYLCPHRWYQKSEIDNMDTWEENVTFFRRYICNGDIENCEGIFSSYFRERHKRGEEP